MGNRERRRVEEQKRESLMTMPAEAVPQVTRYMEVRRRRGQWTLERRPCQIRTNRRWNLVSPTICWLFPGYLTESNVAIVLAGAVDN